MIPLAIDLSAGGPTAAQRLFALALVALFFIILAIVRYRFQFAGLPDDQRRQKRTLQDQRQDQDPETLRIPRGADLEDYRDQIRALFDADDTSTIEDPISPVEAAGEVRSALALSYRDLTEGIPRLSLGMLLEAFVIFVFGSIVVLPTTYFVSLFSGGDGVTLGWVIDRSVSTTATVASTGIDLLAAFPFAQTIFALLLAVAVQAGTILYQTPAATAMLLVLAAGAVLYLEQRTGGIDYTVYDSHLAMVVAGLLAGFVVWIAGVLPAALGAAVGFPTIGAGLGFVLASVVFLLVVYDVLTGLRRQVAHLIDDDLGGLPLAYVVARRGSAAVAFLLAPFALGYLVTSVASGALGGAVGALLGGSLTIQILAGTLLLVVLAGVALQTREAWPEVRAALRETLARKAVRVALFRRAVPVAILMFAYFLGIGLGLNAILAFVAALGAAVLARLLFSAFQRVRYRASLIDSEERTASRVVIQAYRLRTADDESINVATVNTHELAHRDQEELVDAIVDASEQLFEDGDVSPSIESAFATDLFDYGIVDVEETVAKLERKAEETLEHQLAENGGQVDAETLHEELDRFPEQIWRRRVRHQIGRGALRRRNGFYLRA